MMVDNMLTKWSRSGLAQNTCDLWPAVDEEATPSMSKSWVSWGPSSMGTGARTSSLKEKTIIYWLCKNIHIVLECNFVEFKNFTVMENEHIVIEVYKWCPSCSNMHTFIYLLHMYQCAVLYQRHLELPTSHLLFTSIVKPAKSIHSRGREEVAVIDRWP